MKFSCICVMELLVRSHRSACLRLGPAVDKEIVIDSFSLRRFHRGSTALALVFGSLVPTAQAQLPDACASLGRALVEHSCFHSTFGPFNSVLATPGSRVENTTPNLNAVHTEYRVGLPNRSGTNVVTYTPERTGVWTVFLGAEIPIEVRTTEGASFPELLTQRGDTGCEALPVAHVFELQAGTRYTLVFGPTTLESVVVVIEYTNDFLVRSGLDRDRDGYGDPGETVVTNCVPPAGYADNDLDCDDTDPLVNPGARELCDGMDQNCNGSPDDVGLQCRAGVGTCQAKGTLVCSPGAESVQCSAASTPPVDEQCNNADDDCDGMIDEGGGLCASADAPACVRQGVAAFCGCLIDLDCGDGISGRICDQTARTCVDGCSTESGRNQCPGGWECVDVGAGSVGKCEPVTGNGPNSDDDDEPPSDGATNRDEGGCSCRLNQGPSSSRGSLMLLLFAAALAARRRRAGRLSRLLLLALGASALVGCGGIASESPGDDAEAAPCTPVVGLKPVEHACSHARNGSFLNVVAASPGAGVIPSVNKVHATYVVELPEGGARPGVVHYTTSRDGEHLILVDSEEAEVRIAPPGDSPLVPITDGPVSGCEVLPRGLTTNLLEEHTYELTIARAPSSPILLFFEHLGTFGGRAWQRRCP
jgi:MYXO-CTERM domain-containing protein